MSKLKIISIYGASSSGKSTVAKVLEESQPDLFSRIPCDRLIMDRPEDDSDYFKRRYLK